MNQALSEQKWEQLIQLSSEDFSAFYPFDQYSSRPVDFYQGMANQGKCEPQKALANFKRAHQLNPWQPEISFMLGKAMYDLNDFQGAVNLYTVVMEVFPDFYFARFDLALAYYNLGKYAEAFEQLALIPSPNNLEWYSKYYKQTVEKLVPTSKD